MSSTNSQNTSESSTRGSEHDHYAEQDSPGGGSSGRKLTPLPINNLPAKPGHNQVIIAIMLYPFTYSLYIYIYIYILILYPLHFLF